MLLSHSYGQKLINNNTFMQVKRSTFENLDFPVKLPKMLFGHLYDQKSIIINLYQHMIKIWKTNIFSIPKMLFNHPYEKKSSIIHVYMHASKMIRIWKTLIFSIPKMIFSHLYEPKLKNYTFIPVK